MSVIAFCKAQFDSRTQVEFKKADTGKRLSSTHQSLAPASGRRVVSFVRELLRLTASCINEDINGGPISQVPNAVPRKLRRSRGGLFMTSDIRFIVSSVSNGPLW